MIVIVWLKSLVVQLPGNVVAEHFPENFILLRTVKVRGLTANAIYRHDEAGVSVLRRTAAAGEGDWGRDGCVGLVVQGCSRAIVLLRPGPPSTHELPVKAGYGKRDVKDASKAFQRSCCWWDS